MDLEPILMIGTPDNFEALLYILEDQSLPSGKTWKCLAYPERPGRPIPHTVRQWIVFTAEHTEAAMLNLRVRRAATIRASEIMRERTFIEFLDGKGVFSTFELMKEDLVYLYQTIRERLRLANQLDDIPISGVSRDHQMDSTRLTYDSRRKGKAGRPRNVDDDWAWEQVNIARRPMPDIFREWKKRIGDRANTLADPLESFKKATKASRGPGAKK